MKSGYLKWLFVVLALGVAGAIFFTLKGSESLVYFYTPAEAATQAQTLSQKTIRIGAMVKPASVQWQAEQLLLQFVATDLKGHEIAVRYHGSAPDMFKEGQGVVLEGRLAPSGQEFSATRLMVKHSEEYKKADDHGSMNQALLQDAIFKNEEAKP